MTHLCVSILVTDAAQAQRDVAQAAEAGADMVELRIDHITGRIALDKITLPYILTCRPTWEGGHSELADEQRLSLLHEIAQGKASYIDVELKSLPHARNITELPRDARPGLIVSTHDFTGRPARLNNLLVEMNRGPADVNKIVWTARTIRDNLEAFELLRNRIRPTIAFCMGEVGIISRVLAKKFGAFLTFASLDRNRETAPGQVSIHDMKQLYRWDVIGPSTKVYGVVGSPVMHSMSPAIHNVGFEAVDHDGVYLPLLVNPGYESFKAFMEDFTRFEGLDLAGLSVTIPHKENALRYLKEKGAQVEELAERIGAVNTIVISDSKSQISNLKSQISNLRGFNTDYAAILDTITSTLNITREQLAEYRVAVIGAGGTGRTAVAALAEYGATVVVYNRTKDRADALAEEFNGRRGQVVSARLEKLCDSCCHIYINTTSVGMQPNIDASPLGDSPPKFTPDTLVFDTIYNPMQTKLMREASQAGAKTVGGVEMFIRQAARQFQAWTGKPATLNLMREVVVERLSG